MKSWRDIAMDCVTHVSKVRAAKVPKSAFGHANRRKASPLRVESASRPLRGATSSGFVLPTCPRAAEWRPRETERSSAPRASRWLLSAQPVTRPSCATVAVQSEAEIRRQLVTDGSWPIAVPPPHLVVLSQPDGC